MWLNARKVEDETCSVFARKHTVGKVDTLPFRAAIGDPQAGLGRSSYPPNLESRSTTSFLGRAWLTEKETRKVDFEDVRTITITMACWQRGVKPGHAV